MPLPAQGWRTQCGHDQVRGHHPASSAARRDSGWSLSGSPSTYRQSKNTGEIGQRRLQPIDIQPPAENRRIVVWNGCGVPIVFERESPRRRE
jgi:hypothetical protein